MTRFVVVLVGASAMFGIARSADVRAATMSKCQAKKMDDAGKGAACFARLASGAAKGRAIERTQVRECRRFVHGRFPRLDSRADCHTTGDATAIENKIDAFVDDVSSELNLSPPNRCQGTKIYDAGQKAVCLARLEKKFIATGIPLDPSDVAKCQARVGLRFMELEAGGGCDTTGDATAIESKVDAFIDDLTSELNQ